MRRQFTKIALATYFVQLFQFQQTTWNTLQQNCGERLLISTQEIKDQSKDKSRFELKIGEGDFITVGIIRCSRLVSEIKDKKKN